MNLSPQAVAARLRLRDDYEFYAANALKIRTKDGQITPFVFNRAQKILNDIVDREMAKSGKVRVVILKGRQMGLSTWVGGRLYFRVSQKKAAKAIVVTHHADSTRALFDMTKRFHDQCPELLRPSTSYSSRKELKFDRLDSGYSVATAGGEAIGRGETFLVGHFSEFAFWQKSSAKANFNALMKTFPEVEGSELYVESTANGVSGEFHDLWQGAVAGTNGFIAVFLPWFIEPGYRNEVMEGPLERTPEEDALAARAKAEWDVDLDDEQLMFRRRQIAINGADLFMQEYPSFAEEAFLTTGRPVFNPHHLARYGSGQEPIAKMALEGMTWVKHPRGELKVYVPYEPSDTYTIGADPGMGVKKDFSVAQILDRKKRQVAVWRGQADPAYFAEVLLRLGEHYNEALIAVEANAHGILTNYRLSKEFNYPHLWRDTQYEKEVDVETSRVGFLMTARTKPLVIDQLRAEFREGDVEVYDKATLDELRTFIVTDGGSMEAEKGCHDDCVMSLALANHVHEGVWEPVRVEEEHYAFFE